MAGCHEVVWLVGSRRRGKAFVEAFGPWPGRTGMPSGAAEGAAPAAGLAAPGIVNKLGALTRLQVRPSLSSPYLAPI